MGSVAGFPYFEVRFDKQANPVAAAEVDALLGHVREARPTDVVVLAHGWNNDMAQARTLFETLCGNMRDALDRTGAEAIGERTFAVLAVLWPSKKFADRDLIPGGAASLAAAPEATTLQLELRNLHGAFDAPDADSKLVRAEALVARLDDDAQAQHEFVEIMRALLPADTGSAEKRDEVPPELYDRDPAEMLLDLGEDDGTPAPHGLGGAASVGAAAGLGSAFQEMKLGARRLLNYVTYYQMKERAGTVGERGVAPLIRRLREPTSDPGPGGDRQNPRIHLVGHSFGGRLVAAVANASDPGAIASLSLLQAAFSHHGFSSRHGGFFRSVVADGKVRGPILITHTANDTAVGIAYPIASRIGRQRASGLGDRNDPFGGIGRNGAVDSDEVIRQLLPVTGAYTFDAGKLHNLLADGFIQDHGDVAGEEVAHAIVAAIAAS